MRILQRLTGFCVVVLLAAPAARAQEQAQDESAAKRAWLGLTASEELKDLKYQQAQEGGWPWTLMTTVAAGDDSNIFDSPNAETDGVFYDFGLKLENLHYFGEHDSLKLTFAGTGSIYPESSTLASATQKIKLRYANRLSKRIRFRLEGMASHQNDDKVSIDGHEFLRDFGQVVYRVKPSLRFRLSKRQTFTLAYAGKWKNYAETSGQASLDWFAHGPKARYGVKISDSLSFSGGYSFTLRNYDEDLAALANGTELATNPKEEHRYHRFGAKAEWRPADWLVMDGRYRVKTKDDQFDDFESYEDKKWAFGMTLLPMPGLSIRAEGFSSDREYDNRLGELPTETLEYDKVGGSLTAHYQLSRNLALYARFSHVDRDSNRETGSSYRDYEVTTFLAGFAFAR